MARVLTNNLTLSYVVETAIGVADTTGWRTTEPNSIGTFGAEITTVAREPISASRQRRKGTITDLDSAVEFEADLTMSAFYDFVEGFVFAANSNSDLVFTGNDCAAGGITIAAATAAQAAKLQWITAGMASLIFNRGYATAAINGLHPLTADVAPSGTEMTFAAAAVETAPGNAVSEIAGIRAESGDLDIDVTSGVGTITSANNGAVNNIDFTTLGLTVGQFIHVGGLTSGEQFSAGAGYGRVTSIAAATLLLDKLDSTLATDAGAAEQIDLLWGRFFRNVAVGATDYLSQSYSFEAIYTDLSAGPVDAYEYPQGNFCNEITFQLPLTDKALINYGFLGTDTPIPTTSRKTGPSTAIGPVDTGAFNTSSDIARLRITDVDETGLTTDFKSLSLTLGNQVSPEKVLATLGAANMNKGIFLVDIEAQILFTSELVVTRIRNNTTVTMDWHINNDDGVIWVDIPSMTLGGGGKDFPVNETVLVNLSGQAFEDDTFGTSLGISTLPTPAPA